MCLSRAPATPHTARDRDAPRRAHSVHPGSHTPDFATQVLAELLSRQAPRDDDRRRDPPILPVPRAPPTICTAGPLPTEAPDPLKKHKHRLKDSETHEELVFVP